MGLFSKKKKVEGSCCCGNVENLIVNDKQEDENPCGCSCGGDCSETLTEDIEGNVLVLKILGSGCKNCTILADNVKIALDELKLTAEVVKVTDFADITRYGVMSTPALVVNEKVVSYGKVLKTQEIVKILEKLLS